eukprot:751969-Hanusia_phi.AAC.1
MKKQQSKSRTTIEPDSLEQNVANFQDSVSQPNQDLMSQQVNDVSKTVNQLLTQIDPQSSVQQSGNNESNAEELGQSL